jgi:hypothetical protein
MSGVYRAKGQSDQDFARSGTRLRALRDVQLFWGVAELLELNSAHQSLPSVLAANRGIDVDRLVVMTVVIR